MNGNKQKTRFWVGLLVLTAIAAAAISTCLPYSPRLTQSPKQASSQPDNSAYASLPTVRPAAQLPSVEPAKDNYFEPSQSLSQTRGTGNRELQITPLPPLPNQRLSSKPALETGLVATRRINTKSGPHHKHNLIQPNNQPRNSSQLPPHAPTLLAPSIPRLTAEKTSDNLEQTDPQPRSQMTSPAKTKTQSASGPRVASDTTRFSPILTRPTSASSPSGPARFESDKAGPSLIRRLPSIQQTNHSQR